ncbi:MAG: sulfite exporter TauE/SafE family protein [Flavobacteriales bacterium]|nr:sulfite exporter TauE/SafE family protein [Flavobacteriales bacterium]MCB9204033.1 sulfite exporter TauE/SafE family protein [Flavobacteriales bacterium]
MEILGWIMALVIGLTLGLLGGGGSILTVPVLVYLLGINPVISTGYSLFIVGLSSLFGSYAYFKKDQVDLRTAAVFGVPSIIAVYLARKVLVPAIPDEIFTTGEFIFTKSIAIMVLFAVLMIGASYSMIKGRKDTGEETGEVKYNYPVILLEGLVVGTLTGLVGAGGGFLIIPALVLFSGLSMKMAVGTSLLIIAVKSLIGFLGDIQNHAIDWTFLLSFAALAIVGIFLGSKLSNFIPGQKLKPAFGWFVLIMGIYILGKELLF